MQALILAGGEGRRLRPLTLTVPKPVLPLVGRPLVSYMLEWLLRHGVRDVILACGFMAAGVRDVLGDGSALGIGLRYLEEPQPLGTAGALKFAEELLDDRFVMLNGDLLTDIDLTAELRQHEHTGAQATIALIEVADPSAYGLVRCRPDGSVQEFVEKPLPEQIDTNRVNAGAYILERDVLDTIASGTNVSIERDVFPALVGSGLFGYEANGYWLDLGTPERYLQATFDILEGNVITDVGRKLSESGMALLDGARIDGKVLAPAWVASDCVVAERAVVGARTVLGRGVFVGEGSRVESSVLLDGVRVGAGSTVSHSIVGADVVIGERCRIEGDVVIGEGVRIGPDNVVAAGARIFPGVELPAGVIKP